MSQKSWKIDIVYYSLGSFVVYNSGVYVNKRTVTIHIYSFLQGIWPQYDQPC